jgi:hypothetical protein
MIDAIDSRIPNISTTWQLWHSDLFDRDSPPSLQASGTNIIQGLYELWLHTLKEGLLENGSASFSRFHLTWGNTASTRVEIAVNPFNNASLLKLRHWANLMTQNQNGEEERRDVILLRLAQWHYEFLQKSSRWSASAIDWSAESRELLARIEVLKDSKEL